MTYSTQSNKTNTLPDAVDLDRLSDEVMALAQTARRIAANDSAQSVADISVYPDFYKSVRQTGAFLAFSDFVAIVTSFILAGAVAWALNVVYLRNGFQSFTEASSIQHLATYACLSIAALLWLDSKGHYRQRLPYWETIGHIVTVSCCGFLVSGFFEYVSKDSSSRLWMGLSWMLLSFGMIWGRSVTRGFLLQHGLWDIPTLIIGDGKTAEDAEEALRADPSMGFSITGKIGARDVAALTTPDQWKKLLVRRGCHHLFLALDGDDMQRLQPSVQALTRARLPCSIIPPWLGLPSSTLSPHHIFLRDVLILHDTNRLTLPMSQLTKRCFDLVLSTMALAVISPVILVLAILIKRDGGPALFVQPRVGRHGQLFNCLKFRSMRVDAEAVLQHHLDRDPAAAEEWRRYQKLKNDVRITRIGHFIRRCSLDEVPQLINVLKGEMSLVGPRPIMVGQEKLYADDFGLYTSVLPGITGPWQVSGRNNLTFERRVRLEATYARNWSLWQDIVIILKTFPVLFKRGQAF